jgi:hypothetical protein
MTGGTPSLQSARHQDQFARPRSRSRLAASRTIRTVSPASVEDAHPQGADLVGRPVEWFQYSATDALDIVGSALRIESLIRICFTKVFNGRESSK